MQNGRESVGGFTSRSLFVLYHFMFPARKVSANLLVLNGLRWGQLGEPRGFSSHSCDFGGRNHFCSKTIAVNTRRLRTHVALRMTSGHIMVSAHILHIPLSRAHATRHCLPMSRAHPALSAPPSHCHVRLALSVGRPINAVSGYVACRMT
jgi:hypothetical protein